MGARFLDTSLRRWTSADTIVPGNASGSGGGAATLGYDEQVRLVPLTVGFHETQFLSVVGEENREIAAKGFWFQRSEPEKSQSKYQWGPLNPQALNRYAYCLGNVLRYVDPTGHYQWIVISQHRWGPLSRWEAVQLTADSQDLLDYLVWGLSIELALFGPPGWTIDLAFIAFGPDIIPFEEGDHGSDTIYYDPDEGKYWRLVYYFDEDGNLLSHQQYFSWDGVNWVVVTDSSDFFPEEGDVD